MKPLNALLPILAFLLVASTAAALTTSSTVPLTATSCDSCQQAKRTIEQLSDGYRITYNINSFQLADSLTSETNIHIQGFSQKTIENGFALPWRHDAFVVPKGYFATITTESCNYKEFDLKINATSSSTEANQYATSLLPVNIITELPTQIYRKQQVLNVGISPVQYDPATSKARIYTVLSYRVTYTPELPKSRTTHIDSLSTSLSGTIVPGIPYPLPLDSINLKDYLLQTTPADAGYLIISTPELSSGVERFAKWKRMLGYNVECAYQPTWTTEQIKTTIRDSYERDDKLLHLLLVGGHDKVPAVELTRVIKGKETQYITDYPYACLDGDDDQMADLFRGRWATSNADEIETIADKIIHYEQHPTQDSIFYRTGVHCSYFQYSSETDISSRYYNMEGGSFMRSSEDALNYITCVDKPNSSKKEVERIYWEVPKDDKLPLFWNFQDYWYGDPEVPQEVREEIAKQKNFSDFRDAINDGRFYALYRGHGNRTQISSEIIPPTYFETTDAWNLRNNEWAPLFLSICCETGDFQDECFAQALLSNERGGSIATIAATAEGDAGYDAALTCALFNAVWPTPGYLSTMHHLYDFSYSGEKPVYQIGQILDKALTTIEQSYQGSENLGSYTKHIFHCFGDPSMMFTTEVPNEFNHITLDRKTGEVYVKINGEEGYISLYDHNSSTVKRIYGNYLTYKCDNPERVSVVVSGHNMIPFISPAEGYLESGEPERNNPSRIVKCIDQGGVLEVFYELGPDARNAHIMGLDLSNNMIRADVPCTEQAGSVGLHIPYGIYAIVLYGQNIPMHTVRVIVSRNGR